MRLRDRFKKPFEYFSRCFRLEFSPFFVRMEKRIGYAIRVIIIIISRYLQNYIKFQTLIFLVSSFDRRIRRSINWKDRSSLVSSLL